MRSLQRLGKVRAPPTGRYGVIREFGIPAMKVTIERSVLLKALGHVHRIVERRNTIPILANVLIEAADGKVALKSTDLDLEASRIRCPPTSSRPARPPWLRM